MNLVLALTVVSLGSVLLRTVPLLGARALPDAVAETAGWAGVAVLAALAARAVAHHQDPALVLAPLVAAAAVGLGLVVVARSNSILLGVAVCVAGYLAVVAVSGLVG